MPEALHCRLAIIGGGPAGLMAAETARAAGVEVDVFDAMGSVGRKFLVAGKGGLNLSATRTVGAPSLGGSTAEGTEEAKNFLLAGLPIQPKK